MADSLFLCGCAPPRRARSPLFLRRMGNIQSQPMRMDTHITVAKYLIKNNRLRYVSQADPTRIRIRYAPDMGYGGCQMYPRFLGITYYGNRKK
jgi:hypothetical protein